MSPAERAAMRRLIDAAANRENTMGDVCRLIECKAELRYATEHAREIISAYPFHGIGL